MALQTTAELDANLADLGEPMQFGALTIYGIVEDTDEAALAANEIESIGHVRMVTIRTGAVPGLAIGTPVTLRGMACKVLRSLRIDDGALTKLVLVDG